MNDAKQDIRNKRGWGQTIAATPEKRAVMERAEQELAEGIPEDVIRTPPRGTRR